MRRFIVPAKNLPDCTRRLGLDLLTESLPPGPTSGHSARGQQHEDHGPHRVRLQGLYHPANRVSDTPAFTAAQAALQCEVIGSQRWCRDTTRRRCKRHGRQQPLLQWARS